MLAVPFAPAVLDSPPGRGFLSHLGKETGGKKCTHNVLHLALDVFHSLEKGRRKRFEQTDLLLRLPVLL